MDINLFMGIELPNDIGYEVYLNYVQFYRKRHGGDDGWERIGVIPLPYSPRPATWWKEELANVLGTK